MEWFFGRREAREICNSGYPACTLIFATRQATLNGDDATAIAVGREALLARDFPAQRPDTAPQSHRRAYSDARTYRATECGGSGELKLALTVRNYECSVVSYI